jgi:hypothetical protein
VQILLDDEVTSARNTRIFADNERGTRSRHATPVFCTVNEPQKVTLVEIAEAVCFIDGTDRSSDPLHDLGNQFETQVHSPGADVNHRVSRSRNGMAFPRADLAKRMEFGRPRCSEKLVPCIRSESRDAGEPCLYATEIDRTKNPRQIGTERTHGRVALAVRLNADDQEYRGAGERRKNGLRNRCRIVFTG